MANAALCIALVANDNGWDDTGSKPNALIRELLSIIFPQQYHVKQLGHLLIDPSRLLSPSLQFYTYAGSLTTPACAENVTWAVMSQLETVTPQQVQTFEQRVTPMNSRPGQPLHGRQVGLAG